MLEYIFSESFLLSCITAALPIIFAAFAALISNKVRLLNINIDPEELVYPMTPAGAPCTTILLNKDEKYEH